MRLFNHHFLRIFVVLLVTVFITDTVYAGSMMMSASLESHVVNASMQTQAVSTHADEHHQHAYGSLDQNHTHQHHDAGDSLTSHQHQSPSHGSCSDCNHCMACYSMMLDDQVKMASISSQPVLAIATHVLYLAPTNPQPNKPPIS